MKFLALALLLLSSTAFANPAEIPPTRSKFELSRVESVIEVVNSPRVTLVRIDEGGGSDAYARGSLSSLYLNFYQEGESFDIEGTYLILEHVDQIESYRYNASRQSISLVTTTLNKDFSMTRSSGEIYLSDVLKEIKAASTNFRVYKTRSPVGFQNVQI